MTRRFRKSDLPRDEFGRLRAPGDPDEMADLRGLADRVDAEQALLLGMALFDDGRLFESYVHLATAWKKTRDGDEGAGAGAEGLRFLAQAAAGWCHVQRGNPDGARRVLAKARRGLASTAAETLPDIDVDALLVLLDKAIAELEAGASGDPPRALPRANGPPRDRR